MAAHVTSLHVYPVTGEPGVDLQHVAVGEEGLEGDRRKRAAVQVVAATAAGPETRANIIVDLEPAELQAAVGNRLRVGEVVLDVTGVPKGCPGVYAAVLATGEVRVGDVVAVEGAEAPGG